MIRSISRDDGQFVVREFQYTNLYYEASCVGEVYAYCHVQIQQKIAYLHLYMQKWSKSILKSLRADFEDLKEDLKFWCVSLLLGTHPIEGSDKWFKFLKLVGFTEMKDITTKEGEQGKLTFMEVG